MRTKRGLGENEPVVAWAKLDVGTSSSWLYQSRTYLKVIAWKRGIEEVRRARERRIRSGRWKAPCQAVRRGIGRTASLGPSRGR